MEQEVNEKIRERAYELWVANGSLEGQSEVNWLTAEKEVLATHLATPLKGLACLQTAPNVSQAPTKARKRILKRA